MQYIIISLITITISALLINLLVSRLLNVQLKMKPLVLCACCAFLINIVLPRIIIGFVGVIETVGILLIFTIISAYSIAFYNDKFDNSRNPINSLNQTPLVVQASTDQQENGYFCKREEASKSLEGMLLWSSPEIIVTVEAPVSLAECDSVDNMHIASQGDEQQQVAMPEANPKDVIVSLEDEPPIDVTIVEDIIKKIDTISKSEEEQQVVILESNTNDVSVSLADGIFSNDSASDEFIMVDKDEEVALLEEAFEDKELLHATIFDQEDFSNLEDDSKLMNYDNLATIERLDVIDKVDQINEVFELDKENQTSRIEESNEMIQIEDESELPNNIFDSNSNDLDSLMDIAFMHKEQQNFDQALSVFRQALILYPSSEAAPFLVMEIGTILKNNGQYDDAIAAFCDGKKLLGLQKDNTFELEFIRTIAYLRIVKNILHQHHLGLISFNNIPEHVLKEINAEFREWRNPA